MHMIALEPRIVLDAAAMETIAEISQQTVHQQFADEFLDQINGNGANEDPVEQEDPAQSDFTGPLGTPNNRTEVVFISSDIEDIDSSSCFLVDRMLLLMLMEALMINRAYALVEFVGCWLAAYLYGGSYRCC